MVPAELPSGVFVIPAQERVVFGRPAETAVVAEADRYQARRAFVVSTRSLDRLTGVPVQRIVHTPSAPASAWPTATLRA